MRLLLTGGDESEAETRVDPVVATHEPKAAPLKRLYRHVVLIPREAAVGFLVAVRRLEGQREAGERDCRGFDLRDVHEKNLTYA